MQADAEKKIWASIRQGDEGAFRQMYENHVQILYNYGMKFCGDKELVKDSIQDVFKIIWEKRETIEIKQSLKHYLLVVCRRTLLEKRSARQFAPAALPDATFELSIESKLILSESEAKLRRDLDTAMNELTHRQKEIIFLRYEENLPYEEISQIMDLNKNSLYKLLSAAINRLREHLACLLF